MPFQVLRRLARLTYYKASSRTIQQIASTFMSTFQGESNSKMGLEHSATVQIDSADIRIVKEQYDPEHRFAGAHPLVWSEERECEYEHEPKQYIP